MPIDTDEVVVGADGAVYVAPVGTTGPTDIETALDVAFINLGYVSEDGVEMTPGVEMNAIPAWQSFYPIRHVTTGRSLELGFSLLQWNEESIKLAFGGGAIATSAGPPAYYTYTPPEPEDVDYRAVVLEWEDGTKDYRLHIPRALVTDVGSISLQRSNPAGLDLTFSLAAAESGSEFSLITNDPAFAA